jgi:hypothetical protein
VGRFGTMHLDGKVWCSFHKLHWPMCNFTSQKHCTYLHIFLANLHSVTNYVTLFYYLSVTVLVSTNKTVLQHLWQITMWSRCKQFKYEAESVNRTQMDIKRKTCGQTCKKTFISQYILHRHWYTWPITLPACQNLQHRNLLTTDSATSTPPFWHHHQQNVCHQGVFLVDQMNGSH